MTLYINNNDWVTSYEWEVENEKIDVTPERTTKPDPKWSYVDRQGHYHAFSDDEHDLLPTLRGVFDEDVPSAVAYRCRICNFEVIPEWITQRSTVRIYAPGRMSWRVELLAHWPNIDPLMNGTSVSVRIEEDGDILFGVGLLQATGAGVNDAGVIEWRGQIIGNGALGTRKASS